LTATSSLEDVDPQPSCGVHSKYTHKGSKLILDLMASKCRPRLEEV
jgi:hypothetical protein